MDEGGERKNELFSELRPERRIEFFFQGVGAHPWVLGRRNGSAREIYDRLKEDERFPGYQSLAEAQWFFGLSIGFWIQPSGSVSMGGQR